MAEAENPIISCEDALRQIAGGSVPIIRGTPGFAGSRIDWPDGKNYDLFPVGAAAKDYARRMLDELGL